MKLDEKALSGRGCGAYTGREVRLGVECLQSSRRAARKQCVLAEL